MLALSVFSRIRLRRLTHRASPPWSVPRLALAYLFLSPLCAWSQTPVVMNSEILQRLEAMEQRLQQSEQSLAQRNRQLDEALKRIGQLESRLNREEPSTATITPTPTPDPGTYEEAGHDGMQMPARGPRLNIRGYGDTGYSYSRQKPATTNTFNLGQLDLYITSKLNNKLGVVMETVFEVGQNNVIGVDVERILLQYRQSKYFIADLGRYHTSIGFYNTAYHHSTWLQTAMTRPLLFAFEDDGGPLPVHNVGLSFSGQIPSGGLGLGYVAEVGNGRAFRVPGAEPVQNQLDDNRGKSLNFALSARPDSVPGLRVGTSLYIDRLSPFGANPISQKIFAGYLVYNRDRVEFLNEAVWLRDRQLIPKFGDRVTSIPGGYSQFSYRFGVVRPWVRFEMLNPSPADPVARQILMSGGLIRKTSAGVRYDFSEYAAFKVGYDRLLQRPWPTQNLVSAQLSFTF